MILKASQRANGRELAIHLLNGHDNAHVEVFQMHGFMADSLPDAMQEAEALSRGTKCQKYLFSVSLNPPPEEKVPTAAFEDAIGRIEEKMGLDNQPRVIVFHEKHGRRHAHVVWSRIDTTEMKAIQLSFTHMKLREISRALYLENNWKMPQGLIDREKCNPLNFTREQWQQSKRVGDNPQITKQTLKECWAASDGRKAFSSALEQYGFYLAKGDRRGFVAVDWRGEVYSLSRWLGVKNKAIKGRLGTPQDLPSVDETQTNLDQALANRANVFIKEMNLKYERLSSPIQSRIQHLTERDAEERKRLAKKQEERLQREIRKRQSRFRTGLRGLWDRLTGAHSQVNRQNELEASQASLRDRAEKDALILQQLESSRSVQQQLDHILSNQQQDLAKLKKSMFSRLPVERTISLEREFKSSRLQEPSFGIDGLER